jgi:tetratricopeptide (TPR) repeat protein
MSSFPPGARRVLALASPVLVVAALAFSAEPSAGQMQLPDSFTNLKVLPKNISRDDLLATMRGFTEALGVRCGDCHVRKGEGRSARFDFPADDKVMKRRARVMLRMVRTINHRYLDSLPERVTPNVSVTCITCHGGVERPEPIEDIVNQALDAAGVDSAAAVYRHLRERYYGARAYDFTDRPLVVLAGSLARAGKNDQAMGMLKLNLEFLPKSAMTYATMGEIHERAGEKDQAIAAYTKALQIEPDNRMIQRQLQRLKGGGGGGR